MVGAGLLPAAFRFAVERFGTDVDAGHTLPSMDVPLKAPSTTVAQDDR